MQKVIKKIKENALIIIIIIGGIIDATTDLLVQLLQDIEAPLWTGTMLRIIIISIGVIKANLDVNKRKRNRIKNE